jgi:protein-disulfide isomerase
MHRGKLTKKPGRAPAPPVPTRERRASPRVLVAVAVAVVLVIAGVVLATTLGGGSSDTTTSVPARGSLVNALPGAAAVQAAFQGVPQRGNVLGAADAPVTLVEYVDLQCPYCREFELQVMPGLIKRYVRPGTLRVELRPIVIIGPDSTRGRDATIAAGDQNRMFNFSQLTYLNQGTENTGWLDENFVTRTAASIPGLKVPELLTAMDSAKTADTASAFDEQAAHDGISGTPTILVGKTGGTPRTVAMTSVTDEAAVVAAIEAARR